MKCSLGVGARGDAVDEGSRSIDRANIGVCTTRVEPPKTVTVVQAVKPKDQIFEREEILQRVAGFEATQRKFQREREEYFNKTMARVRSKSF